MITRLQISAGRALLEWTQDDLSQASGVSKDMISKIEGGKSSGSLKSIQALENALTIAGLEFGDNERVSKSSNKVHVLKGQRGFLEFYDHVYEELKSTNSKFAYVCNVDENEFVKWQGDNLKEHTARMTALGIQYKIMIRHGDTFFPASDYGEYRWMPEGMFSSVPYYLFGGKLAFLIFTEEEPRIYILNEPDLSSSYKSQFDSLWQQSTKPEANDAA